METVMDKKYTLRGLKASDFFLVTRILSKIGVKEFKRCFESEEIKSALKNVMQQEGTEASETDVTTIGIVAAFDVASVVMERMENCEKDIYKLLSCLSGMTEKDIMNLPMADFGEMVIDVIKHEGFRDFFTAVVKQFK